MFAQAGRVELMGKQSKLRQTRKMLTLETDICYLDLSFNDARAFRCAIANAHLKLFPKEQLKKFCTLPLDFFCAFYRLLGHLLVGARQYEFWDEICTDLKTVTVGQENLQSLAAWNKGNKDEIVKNPRIHCFNILQKWSDIPMLSRIELCQKEIIKNYLNFNRTWYVEGIPHHIGISAAIAGGGSLHVAGTLHLIANGPKNSNELWLARLRPDGIYATSQLAKTGNLKISEVKSMKKFIANYSGNLIGGHLELFHGNEATRICKLLGMTIKDGVAWIGCE